MKTRITSLAMIATILFLTGCETLLVDQSADTDRMQMMSGMRALQEDNRKLSGRVEALEIELQRMQTAVSSFRSDTTDSLVAGTRGVNTRLDNMEKQVFNVVQQQDAQKQEIIDTISQKVALLMQSQPPASSSARSGSVYEYVVQPGDSVSAIAKAYKTSIDKILTENNLSNPNLLRAGQTIYIPAH